MSFNSYLITKFQINNNKPKRKIRFFYVEFPKGKFDVRYNNKNKDMKRF